MSIKDSIDQAYSLVNNSTNVEGTHIHFVQNKGNPNEQEVGILEFLDETTVYVEQYGSDLSDVRDVSDYSKSEFESFVREILDI